jgi:hypothetical protein
MKKRNIFISMVITLTFVGVILSGIILVDAAKAGKAPPLTVSLALPSSVNFSEVFNISVTVTNKNSTAVNINKFAVGYALQMFRFKGPYEVTVNPVTVPAFGTKSFVIPFRIYEGSGTVVGLAVILANNSYTEALDVVNPNGIMGNAYGGIKVN